MTGDRKARKSGLSGDRWVADSGHPR